MSLKATSSHSTQEAPAPTAPNHTWVRNLALAFASLAITCLVLEMALRILVPEGPPGTTYGRPVYRNSLGLRDRDFAVPKPEGVRRIIVLGDSFTWGVGLDAKETIPKRLEALLAESGRTTEVVNAAQPGDNTVEQLMMLEGIGPRYEPDLVLVIYNLNDIEYRPELARPVEGEDVPPESAATPVVEIDPDEDITRYSKNAGFRGMVLAAERRSILVRFLVPRVGMPLRRMGILQSVEFSWVQKIFEGFKEENPGWRESKRALRDIDDYCRQAGCRVMLAIYPLLVELDNYQGGAAHTAIGDFSRSLGIETLDLLQVFEGTRASSHWINVLDSHPDAAAHDAVARLLLPLVLHQLDVPAGTSSAPSEESTGDP